MNSRAFLLAILWSAMLANISSAQNPEAPADPLPVTGFHMPKYYEPPLTGLAIRQQRARFEAEQQVLRTQWHNWIGYSPLRPTVNADYMSYTSSRYYVPSRGVIITPGSSRAWYW